MKSLIEYLNCGHCIKLSNYNHVNFVVTKFDDIQEKIIPFFKKYPIYGIKALDFADFCKVAELMKKKAHLSEGFDLICKIKKGMNKERPINKT